jgi:gas vesicle protein
MKNTLGILAAFLGGAIVGGALGLLFAPESGEVTRKKLADVLEKKGIKLNDFELDELISCFKSKNEQKSQEDIQNS